MTGTVPVVDVFSGPGGLGEGFAGFRDSNESLRFRIALSIEMDPTAHRTLRLRAFLRKFPNGFPSEYYDFLNRAVTEEPDWAALYPEEWQEACDETQKLELGISATTAIVRERIRKIRNEHGCRTVLLGGPPCQSYSVAGRVRNASKANYKAEEDERQSLYLEYAKVLGQLQPAVAVMENVKGMLSARHEGSLIMPRVLDRLRHAGSANRYRLFALSSPRLTLRWTRGLQPKDFLVRANEHGVPQSRHRVFVVCIRTDIARDLPEQVLPSLERRDVTVSINDVIGTMPILRSRLSRKDNDASWRHAVREACEIAWEFRPAMEQDQKEIFCRAIKRANESTQGSTPPFRDAVGGVSIASSCPTKLRRWIVDDKMTRLPNNETRGHMQMDLARYLYAAAFACVFGTSPKTSDFPKALAPEHTNWYSGKFHDRFRVQLGDRPSTTVTSHISKDGHYFIHPDPAQCRSLTVREAARLQTFPDNYFFHGGRTQQYIQVGNAVPPFLALQIAEQVWNVLEHQDRTCATAPKRHSITASPMPATGTVSALRQSIGGS